MTEGYETQNPYFMSLALTKRTITGPGLAPMVWQYTYEPDHASVARNCVAPKVCQNTSLVDVTDPDGTLTRYTSSTRSDALEGELLRVDYDIVNDMASKIETREYYAPDGVQAWVFPFGYPMGGDNQFKTGQIHPVRKTTIVQQGRTFVNEVTDFDEFVQPTRVIRWSTP